MTTKQEQEKNYTTMANWALILSILSWLILGIVLAPAAFVLGAKSLRSSSSATRATGTIAMVISGIGLALLAITFMVGLAAIGAR